MLEMGYSSSSSHLLKRFRVASPEKEMLLSLRCLKWKKVFFLSREWNIWPGQRYSKIPAGQVSHLARELLKKTIQLLRKVNTLSHAKEIEVIIPLI